MGTTFQYRSRGLSTVADLHDALERARASFRRFKGFQPGDHVDLYFERTSLAGAGPGPGLRLHDLTVIGHWQADEPDLPIQAVLDTVGLPDGWSVAVTTGFEERTSRQSEKRGYDVVSLRRGRGPTHFSYLSNASRVTSVASYRRDFMTSVAAWGRLPLAVVEGPKGFRLEHSRGGALRVTQSELGGRNPSGFDLELDVGTADAVAIAAEFVSRFGSGRRFDQSWRVAPSTPAEPGRAAAAEVLEWIAAAGMPARLFEIQATAELDALEGLDALRRLCGTGDVLETGLASFEAEEGQRVNLSAWTSADGHRLHFESRLPIDLEDVGQRLGLTLEEHADAGAEPGDAE